MVAPNNSGCLALSRTNRTAAAGKGTSKHSQTPCTLIPGVYVQNVHIMFPSFTSSFLRTPLFRICSTPNKVCARSLLSVLWFCNNTALYWTSNVRCNHNCARTTKTKTTNPAAGVWLHAYHQDSGTIPHGTQIAGNTTATLWGRNYKPTM